MRIERCKFQVLSACLLLIIIFYSCGTTQPARTNVLAKPKPNANQNIPPKKNTNTAPQNQTVFTQPQQTTRNNNPITNNNNNTSAKSPQRGDPENDNAEAVAAAVNTYRSPAYYKNITDSIQRVAAKPSYYRKMDEFMKQMSTAPNPKNPAINAAQWYTTVNFDMRKPNFVILHHTAQNSAEQTLFTFSIPRTEVSAHYVVGRDGVVYQMLNDYMRAYHAGRSKWGAITDMNSCSLGIEIDNNGTEPFSDAQINALLKLLDYLKDEYGIPQANFIAHSDIAPTRKSDPSKFFPWGKLAGAGFGYWYDQNNMAEPSIDFNPFLALRVIGYDTRDQGAAIKAFKLHYIQNDTSPVLTAYDKKVLYNIYRNY